MEALSVPEVRPRNRSFSELSSSLPSPSPSAVPPQAPQESNYASSSGPSTEESAKTLRRNTLASFSHSINGGDADSHQIPREHRVRAISSEPLTLSNNASKAEISAFASREAARLFARTRKQTEARTEFIEYMEALNSDEVSRREAMMEARGVFNAYDESGQGSLNMQDAIVYFNDLLVLCKRKKRVIKKLCWFALKNGKPISSIDIKKLYRGYLQRCFKLMDFENNGILDFEEMVQPWELDEFLEHVDIRDIPEAKEIAETLEHGCLDLEDLLEKKRSELVRLQAQVEMKLSELRDLEIRLQRRPWRSCTPSTHTNPSA